MEWLASPNPADKQMERDEVMSALPLEMTIQRMDRDTRALHIKMKQACLRCKTLKVRCEKPEGQDCARCAKSRSPCVLAPPSRQGKRDHFAIAKFGADAPPEKRLSVSRGSALVRGAGIFGMASLTSSVSVLPPDTPRDLLRTVLREATRLAIVRNEWRQLNELMAKSRAMQFEVNEIFLEREPSSLMRLVVPPVELANLLSNNSIACYVRRHDPTPEGDVIMYANVAFERLHPLGGDCSRFRTLCIQMPTPVGCPDQGCLHGEPLNE